MKNNNLILVIAFAGVFLLGLMMGGLVAYIQIQMSFEKVLSNLKIEKIEIGFNETYIMDRINETLYNSIREEKK